MMMMMMSRLLLKKSLEVWCFFYVVARGKHETTKEQHNETHVGLSSLFNVSNEEKKHVINDLCFNFIFIIFITRNST